MDQIKKINYLINYNRTKTLREQTEVMSPSSLSVDTSSLERQVLDKDKESFSRCSNKPEKCIESYYVCPPNSKEYNIDEYCWYSSLSDSGALTTRWNPRREIIAVLPDDDVKFVDPSLFFNIPKMIAGEGIEESINSKGQTVKNVISQATLYGEISNADSNRFRRWAVWFLTRPQEEQDAYIISKIAPPGSVWSINSNGKEYKLKFELVNIDTKRADGKPVTVPRLVRKGYYSNNEEYKSPRASDLRNDWQRFIDNWGDAIQIGVALVGVVAGIFTGGSSLVLTTALLSDLVVSGAIAQRRYEQGDIPLAFIELLFGSIPLLNLTADFANISKGALKSLGSKLATARNLNTEQKIINFWRTLTDEERKALAIINRQESHFQSRVTRAFNKQLNIPNSRVSRQIVRDLISSVDDSAGKDIVLSFWKSASGKELKITGLLMAINEYFATHSNTKKLDEKLQENIQKVIDLLYQKIGEKRASPIIEEMVKEILDNPDKQSEANQKLEDIQTEIIQSTEDAIDFDSIDLDL